RVRKEIMQSLHGHRISQENQKIAVCARIKTLFCGFIPVCWLMKLARPKRTWVFERSIGRIKALFPETGSN
ncbi:hypothetical protein ACFL33_05355, partial [Pseudomonadota bacterium]